MTLWVLIKVLEESSEALVKQEDSQRKLKLLIVEI